jgi:hypothetical protein
MTSPPLKAMRVDGECRVRRGGRFTDVGEVIDASDLCNDEKTALWLRG